jgi:predicted Rossmann fold nucleotide-binding protein DprA/Smf involved in DNA uptake
LKRSFRDELEEYERENQMPYVTSIERMGIEQERQKIALKMLQENMPLDVIARITELTIEQLQQLQLNNTDDRS